MKKLVFLIFALSSFTLLYSQHLPLQIGNQWHYAPGLVPSNYYAALATDTVVINNIKYFKIEYWNPDASILYWTHYDRIEGDSLYYSYNNGVDNLVFNFNWQDNFIFSTPSSIDTNCIDLMLVLRNPGQVWGVSTDLYNVFGGFYCTGMIDTAWTLSSLTYSKYFGGTNARDGVLVGALINGVTYGTLYPLPVELLSFTSSVVDDNVTLNWATATETNNSGFNIERKQVFNPQSSVVNQEWKTISFVNGNGTTTEPQTYSFNDENLSAGKYQYKLKQIDFDGTFEYSNIVEIEILPPTKFSLEQNYPNPFNPTTNIQYAIASRQFVSLKIFNALGEVVETLVNEYQETGTHSKLYIVNSTLPSGVYYYQLKAGSFVETKKMLVLK